MALQVLSKSNILNGNVVQASDISQSIDALTGAVGYAITISGSFAFAGQTTGSGYFSNAVTSDNVKPQNVVSNIGYTIPYLASTGSTSALYYSATGPTYNPTTQLLVVTASQAVSASQAVTASFASSAKILGSYVASGSSAIPNTQLNFIAGAGKTSGGVLNVTLAELTGKTLGQNCFVSLALSSSAGLGPVVQVGSLNTGILNFASTGGDADFFYTIIYV
jgi:hypothetical protein